MAITAADVKKLRDETGAGMMDAKKALTEADGDFDRAVELLRVSGQAKAAKRSDREASNGIVAASGNTLIQLGAETDFVAKNEEFVALADTIAAAVAQANVDGVEEAKKVSLENGTVGEAVEAIAVKIGEKIELVAAATFTGTTEVYLHRRSSDLPAQVGVMLEYTGADATFARQICMQIASMSPSYLTEADVPQEEKDRELRIAIEKAREEGKPEDRLEMIAQGRLKAYYKDVCLLEQEAVYAEKKSVAQTLKDQGATVTRFVRYSAGA